MITLKRDLSLPIEQVCFPKEYALVNVTENCSRLWEEFMDGCFGGYQPGSFRYVYVNNNYYEQDRVYVLLDAKNVPVAAGNSWRTPQGDGYISWVGVSEGHRRRQLGCNIVNYCLRDIKRRGLESAIITTEEDNYAAIKTYMKCGFVPLPRCEEDILAWEGIYAHLGICAPECATAVCPEEDMPHPPRPWPYQLAREREAIANGDVFVHGVWNRFNMYEVDRGEYGKLEAFAQAIDERSDAVYVDSDVNPQAALIINADGRRQLGASGDGCFEEGIILFEKDF